MDPGLELLLVDDSPTERNTRAQVLTAARMIGSQAGHEVVTVRTGGVGLAAARNLGLASATTPYVLFLDDDDLWCPHHAERLLEHLERGASFVTAPTGVLNVWDEGPAALTNVGFGWHGLEQKLRVTNVIAPSSVGVHRDSMVPFDIGLDIQEDWDAWLRMLAAGHRPKLTSGLTCAYVKDTRAAVALTVRAGRDPEAQQRFVRNRRRILGLDDPKAPSEDEKTVEDRSRWEAILRSWATRLESGNALDATYYERALATLFGPPQLQPCCNHDFAAAISTERRSDLA